jgi:hypothetical protein
MTHRSPATRLSGEALSYTMDRGNTQPQVAMGGAALPLTGFFRAE